MDTKSIREFIKKETQAESKYLYAIIPTAMKNIIVNLSVNKIAARFRYFSKEVAAHDLCQTTHLADKLYAQWLEKDSKYVNSFSKKTFKLELEIYIASKIWEYKIENQAIIDDKYQVFGYLSLKTKQLIAKHYESLTKIIKTHVEDGEVQERCLEEYKEVLEESLSLFVQGFIDALPFENKKILPEYKDMENLLPYLMKEKKE